MAGWGTPVHPPPHLIKCWSSEILALLNGKMTLKWRSHLHDKPQRNIMSRLAPRVTLRATEVNSEWVPCLTLQAVLKLPSAHHYLLWVQLSRKHTDFLKRSGTRSASHHVGLTSRCPDGFSEKKIHLKGASYYQLRIPLIGTFPGGGKSAWVLCQANQEVSH